MVLISDAAAGPAMRNPTLVRARRIKSRTGNGVLLPLSLSFAQIEEVVNDDVSFAAKKDRLVYRGPGTGAPCTASWAARSSSKLLKDFSSKLYPKRSRFLLAERYHSSKDTRIDIGLASIAKHCDASVSATAMKLLKQPLSRKEMLRSKFIVVPESFGIVEDLGWVLASKSVPFMQEPRYETWLLESKLLPWVHYVPVAEDFSDLAEKFQQMIANPQLAENIAWNGQNHMSQFSDGERESRVATAVLLAYQSHMQVDDSLGIRHSSSLIGQEESVDTRLECSV
jgi:hypothetical protein